MSELILSALIASQSARADGFHGLADAFAQFAAREQAFEDRPPLSDVRTAHSGQAATPRAGNGGAVHIENDNASKALAADVRLLSP